MSDGPHGTSHGTWLPVRVLKKYEIWRHSFKGTSSGLVSASVYGFLLSTNPSGSVNIPNSVSQDILISELLLSEVLHKNRRYRVPGKVALTDPFVLRIIRKTSCNNRAGIRRKSPSEKPHVKRVWWGDPECLCVVGWSRKAGHRIRSHNFDIEECSDRFSVRRISARVSVGQKR